MHTPSIDLPGVGPVLPGVVLSQTPPAMASDDPPLDTPVAPALGEPPEPDERLVFWARALALMALAAILVWMGKLVAPLATAALLALMLWPPVAFLRRHGIPTVVGAALMVAAVMALCTALALLMRTPVADFADRWPHIRTAVEQEIGAWRKLVAPASRPPSTPVLAVQVDARGRLVASPVKTADAGPRAATKGSPAPALLQAPEPAEAPVDWWTPVQKLGEWMASGAQMAAATLFTLFLALYAFLASGHRVVTRTLRWLGRSPKGRRIGRTLELAQRRLQAYWMTVGIINLAVAGVMTLVFWAVGLSSPLLWGLCAGLLNFIPVVGPLLCTGLLALAAAGRFDGLGAIAAIPGLYLLLHAIESQVVTPWVLGQRLSLNPALVVIAILLGTWAWGVLGTLLAVPLLLCLKMYCDQSDELQPVGGLLE